MVYNFEGFVNSRNSIGPTDCVCCSYGPSVDVDVGGCFFGGCMIVFKDDFIWVEFFCFGI
jgi:hypothetical protein